MNQYLNLNQAAVAVIYASIPQEVLEGDTGMNDKFNAQTSSSKHRGIPMELTREQWCAIWWVSGKWHQRGRNSLNSYQMCRKNDEGTYSMGNVRIDTILSNLKDQGLTLDHSFIATKIATGEEYFCESVYSKEIQELGLLRGSIKCFLNGKYPRPHYKGFTFRYA